MRRRSVPSSLATRHAMDPARDPTRYAHLTMRTLTHSVAALAALALIAGSTLTGCSATPASSGVMTKASQQAMTPDQAIQRLADGNARFASGRSVNPDFLAQADATANGQFPFAVVLCCIDSRSAPEIIFDQGLGDLFVPRIAGNYAQADILGSMEFATAAAGAKAIMVVGHTGCGAVMGACDHVQMGNLTTVIDAIRPAVLAVPGFQNNRTSTNTAFVRAVTEENVRLTVAKIRNDSAILRDLEQAGKIKIVGAMHDLSTHKVTLLN